MRQQLVSAREVARPKHPLRLARVAQAVAASYVARRDDPNELGSRADQGDAVPSCALPAGRGASPRCRSATSAAVPQLGVGGVWHLAGGGACQGRPACGTATGWTRTTPSEAPASLQWLATMYSVRPSSPPSMHEKQPRSAMTVSRTSPPSATRVQRWPGTLAYQIAPSASAQMPSGAEPGPRSAQTCRSTSSPESVIVQAVSRS